jgi:DNA-directed RNA polymerase specialized sigma24 family protein
VPRPNEFISIEATVEGISDDEIPSSDPLAKLAFRRWLRDRYFTDGRQYDWALCARIYEILSTLPEITQDVVQMRIDGYRHDQIAQDLGISSGNSRLRYKRALDVVRERLGIAGLEITRQLITTIALD